MAVTREQVLVACRERFAKRWGRPFDRIDEGFLRVLHPDLRDDAAERAKVGPDRYNRLKDALRRARDVEAEDPSLSNEAFVLRRYLPALGAILSAIETDLAVLPADAARGWDEWLHIAAQRFDDGQPLRDRDLAVLRILSGHDLAFRHMSKAETSAEAIAAVARLVKDRRYSRRQA